MKLTKLFLLAILVSIFAIGCQQQKKEEPAKPEVMEVLSVDSVKISYDVKGKGDVALVFVHGWCCDKTYWKYQVPEFSKNYKVVTLDLAGHGKSTLGRKEYSINSFGMDVANVAKKLGLNRMILIGHSMGGMVIAEASTVLKDKVVGLIGVDTYQDLSRKYSKEEYEQFMEPFKKDFQSTTYNWVTTMFPENADTNLVKAIATDMSEAPSEVGLGAWNGMMNWEPENFFNTVSVPMVSINADLWPTNLEANKNLVPSYQLKMMPGYGHFIQQENPEEFNKLLKETINEIIKPVQK